MKTIYKKIFLVGSILAIMPFLVSAKSENANKGYCDRVSEAYSRFGQKIDELNEKLNQKRAQITVRLEERRENRDVRFIQKREKWDLNREEHFAMLEEKAGTDEQKQALLDFKQIVTQAIIDRREAIDQAIEDFRKGVEDLKVSRFADVDQVIVSYRNELRLAFENAQKQCDQGSEQGSISQGLRNQLKNAKNGFLSNKEIIDKIGDGIQNLIDAKEEAMQKAKDDFKDTIAQALLDFKAAFPETEDSE
jgi:flavin-binding protein dodecin